jgi:hypothetical protein
MVSKAKVVEKKARMKIGQATWHEMLAYKTVVWRYERVGRVVASWLQVVCLKTFEEIDLGDRFASEGNVQAR